MRRRQAGCGAFYLEEVERHVVLSFASIEGGKRAKMAVSENISTAILI